jgi:diguanylate cyclase (GGDEF)-like protein
VNQGTTHDDFESRYWLRTATAGGWVTVLMSIAGIVYLAAFTEPEHRVGLAVVLAIIGGSGVVGLFAIPWEKVVASPWRERAFLTWAALTVLMIWLLTLVDGGEESPLKMALFLPVIFASISFPVRYVVTLWILAEVAFLSLAVDGQFDGGEVLVFSAVLAGTATMALWQAKNHDGWRQELARSSTTDPLTQLLNRRGFAMASARAFATLARHGRPVTLVIIDLDYLKTYNDEHGHQAGDELLRWVGDQLSSVVRDVDAVARLGGDEFAVLLPETSLEDAAPVIARISTALDERAAHCLGAAAAPDEGSSFDALYRSADDKLYQQKLRRPPQQENRPREVVPEG